MARHELLTLLKLCAQKLNTRNLGRTRGGAKIEHNHTRNLGRTRRGFLSKTRAPVPASLVSSFPWTIIKGPLDEIMRTDSSDFSFAPVPNDDLMSCRSRPANSFRQSLRPMSNQQSFYETMGSLVDRIRIITATWRQ